jgi:formylglycine-generating enzyme
VSPGCNLGAHLPRKVMKSGVHLCAQKYCRRGWPAAGMPQPVDTPVSHLGFRPIVREPTAPGLSGPWAELPLP